MKHSIVLPPEVRELDRALDLIVRAEQLGFHSAMLGCGQHMDPLTVFALARQRTQRRAVSWAWLISRGPSISQSAQAKPMGRPASA